MIGDGRMDDPGWNAKYCTCTLLAYESGKKTNKLDIVFVDKRVVRREVSHGGGLLALREF